MDKQITVKRTVNSTPNRNWDFQAWYGDLDLGSIVGDGATPNEAIADLEEKREERNGRI
jgi:hypothetical protein